MSQISPNPEETDQPSPTPAAQSQSDLAQSFKQESMRVGQADQAQDPALDLFLEQACAEIEGWTSDEP